MSERRFTGDLLTDWAMLTDREKQVFLWVKPEGWLCGPVPLGGGGV